MFFPPENPGLLSDHGYLVTPQVILCVMNASNPKKSPINFDLVDEHHALAVRVKHPIFRFNNFGKP